MPGVVLTAPIPEANAHHVMREPEGSFCRVNVQVALVPCTGFPFSLAMTVAGTTT
jgi:hypothetical protein